MQIPTSPWRLATGESEHEVTKKTERYIHEKDRLWDSKELISKNRQIYSSWGRKDLEAKRIKHENKCRQLDMLDAKKEEARVQERRQRALEKFRAKTADRKNLEESIGAPYRTKQIIDKQKTIFSNGRRFNRLGTPNREQEMTFDQAYGSMPVTAPADPPRLTRTGRTAAGDQSALNMTSQARGLLMSRGGGYHGRDDTHRGQPHAAPDPDCGGRGEGLELLQGEEHPGVGPEGLPARQDSPHARQDHG
ncbi:hypothetical protein J8273_0371 [Carpediemonas membranifera]|uniref:Uncharacterized protein n=1 Tax=Carpediemonas membranifera TaxID=201153 RepID=A0A8J6E504_9EUKA|nr:hypothetical protein J8273_0371 [Carpediemonas membranifera]|eukprot:KAG9395152.1 hypothetical protein J8273_0371 [Carpediemonas membranifera]